MRTLRVGFPKEGLSQKPVAEGRGYERGSTQQASGLLVIDAADRPCADTPLRR
jgi:hypothetical protein